MVMKIWESTSNNEIILLSVARQNTAYVVSIKNNDVTIYI